MRRSLLFVLLAVTAAAQPFPSPSTVYTRSLLRSADAASARTLLGVSTGGVANPFPGTLQITNQMQSQDAVVTNNVTAGGTITGAKIVSTGAGVGAVQLIYATADAFSLNLARSASAQTNYIQLNFPSALPTTPSLMLVTQNGATNGDVTFSPPTTSFSGTLTNPVFYGPEVTPIGYDSTNLNWATNSYRLQGITTNASFTNKFINNPPAAGAQIVYTVVNTAATNFTVFFLLGNDITNNTYLRGNTTALTSFDVPPGVNKFEWGYNGLKYFFQHEGPSVTFATYAAGTAYTLTATPALTDFGTTDPIVTFTASGTYRLKAGVGVKYTGSTYGTAQTITVKLRKTNGSAADVANATRTVELPVLTTFTGGDYINIPDVDFTVATGDVVQLFSSVSALPSVGTVVIDSAEIVADRKY